MINPVYIGIGILLIFIICVLAWRSGTVDARDIAEEEGAMVKKETETTAASNVEKQTVGKEPPPDSDYYNDNEE